jgi:hypothetical protein
MANRNLDQVGAPVPNKIFVFGNLKIKTHYASKGYVTWWYHVAPIVQLVNQKFVLDPALNSKGPTPLVDWLALMGNPKDFKIAICASGTYSPRGDCSLVTDGIEGRAEASQKSFLDLEWNRLLNLKRKPQEELGDHPPWLEGYYQGVRVQH